jgi:hypothetical protein
MFLKTSQAIFFISITVQLIFLTACDSNPYDNRKFDQKLWIENPVIKDRSSNFRLEMSADLLKNHLQIGMTKQNVNKLLGAGSETSPTCVVDIGTDCYSYYLGEHSTSLILGTYHYLDLNFNKSGILVKKDIHTFQD